MKNLFQSSMPTYMHPEAQIKMPNCPPTKTEQRGTNPVAGKKSIYEAMAMKKIMDDPFQLNSHTAPEVDEVQLEIERANLTKQRLLEPINFSE